MTGGSASRHLAIAALALAANLILGVTRLSMPQSLLDCPLISANMLPEPLHLGSGGSLEYCRDWGRESITDFSRASRGSVTGSDPLPEGWRRFPDWTRWVGMFDDRWRYTGDCSRCATGWPMRSLVAPISSTGVEWKGLRPLWIGLAIDTLALALLFESTWLGSRTIRRLRRRSTGRCVQCGYRLVDSARCPECGSTATSSILDGRGSIVPIAAWAASLIGAGCVFAGMHGRYDREWEYLRCSEEELSYIEMCSLGFFPDEPISAEQWEHDGIDSLYARLELPPPCPSDHQWTLNSAIDGVPVELLEYDTVMFYETPRDAPRVGDEADFLRRLRTTGRAPAVIVVPGFRVFPDTEEVRRVLRWHVDRTNDGDGGIDEASED